MRAEGKEERKPSLSRRRQWLVCGGNKRRDATESSHCVGNHVPGRLGSHGPKVPGNSLPDNFILERLGRQPVVQPAKFKSPVCFYFPLTALACFLCLCGPQIRGVQRETSAIFEKGGLQPQERHPLHAMFRTDGGQPEGAHRVLPLVHVSAPVLAEPNLFIIPPCLLLFLFINY